MATIPDVTGQRCRGAQISAPTVVTVYEDGSVYVGTKHLRSALLHEEPDPFQVYVNEGGILREVRIRQEQGTFDEDDYATVTVRLFPASLLSEIPDPSYALLTFTYTVDGRS